MPDPKTINLVDDTGTERSVPEADAGYYLKRGWTQQTAEGHAQGLADKVEADIYGGAAGTVIAGAAAGARGLTGGASDALIAGMGGGETLAKLRRQNEVVSTVGEIAGGLSSAGFGGLATKAGARVAGTGGGALRQIARAGVSGAVEGGIQGVGAGVTELALSDKPLDIEHIASTLGSNMLYGGIAGGVAGAATKGIERGLTRAKAALDDVAARPLGTLGDIPEDLAQLDRKGLRAAEKAEHEAIEAGRVTHRAELADEIKVFRQEQKANKLFLATKDAEDAEVRSLAARSAKADKQIRNLIDNPKRLAEKPELAKAALQQQESALEDLVTKHGEGLRAKFATDATGDRLKALDYAATALERNRSLQAKIADITAKPSSPRLQAIADATDALSAPKPQGGMVGDLLGGSVFGHVAGAFSGLPVVGPMLGAKAAKAVSGLFANGGKLGSAATEAAARGSKAVGAFLDVTRKVSPAAPVLATKVLGAVRYSAQEERKPKRDAGKPAKEPSLAASYKARAAEVREAVEPSPDGSGAVRARPAVRQQIAKQLSPLAAHDPVLADRLETIAARRVEFLASKLPRKPDAFGMQVGPDKWQPSDMEMRTWARYVAAVEDPGGVVERLADGSVTPEDAETMRTVYPEMYADIQQQILQQLPTLRATLPYQRRLAFSVFSGVPVDPTLDPNVLSRLQSSFAMEEGTEQGTQAPRAQPAFGSVSKPEPTAAQQRGA